MGLILYSFPQPANVQGRPASEFEARRVQLPRGRLLTRPSPRNSIYTISLAALTPPAGVDESELCALNRQERDSPFTLSSKSFSSSLPKRKGLMDVKDSNPRLGLRGILQNPETIGHQHYAGIDLKP